MKEYLKLDVNCGCVEGKTGTMLFDFKNKKAYRISEIESKALTKMLQGNAVEDVVLDNENIKKFVNQLLELGLAFKKGIWSPTEKFHKGSLYELHPEYRIILNNIFIELPGNCEEKCEHCGKSKINGCFTCVIPSSTEYNKHYYSKMIGEVAAFRFKNIYFYGGDIFKEKDRLIEILRYTRLLIDKGENIFLICNYKHVNYKLLEILRELDIRLIIGFDCIGKSSKEILSSISKVAYKMKNMKWCANLCLDSSNAILFETVKQEVLKTYQSTDIVYSIYVQSDQERLKYHTDIPKIYCDETTFFLLEKVNPCLAGTLAINAKGEVRPCPCIDEVIGKIDYEKGLTFSRVFGNTEKIREFWELSIDKLEPCKECEYRRTCSDCRAIDFMFGNIYKKSLCGRTL